jgi:hypothetical protein
VLGAGILAVAGWWHNRGGSRFAPAFGDAQVLLHCRDRRLRLQFKRGNEVVALLGPGPSFQALPAGDYELEVTEGAPELRGFTGRLSLRPGERRIVEVRREGIFVPPEGAFPPPPGPPRHPPPGRRPPGDEFD